MGRTAKRAEQHVENIIHYQDVFKTRKGKNVLYDLCKKFNYFQTSYQGNPNDCVFNEGGRNVVNYIMLQLQQNAPKVLDEMRKRLKEEIDYED